MTFRYEPANPFTMPPAGGCQPGLVELRRFLQTSYTSAIFAGCYADRAISGATAPSLHRDGRALDINFGRPEQFVVALAELVNIGERIGVQQILDYRGNRSWRPGRGWRAWTAPAGRTHLHIEMTIEAAADRRPIVARLRPPAPIPPPPISPPPPIAPTEDDMASQDISMTTDDRGCGYVHVAVPFAKALAVSPLIGHPANVAQAFPGLEYVAPAECSMAMVAGDPRFTAVVVSGYLPKAPITVRFVHG